MSPEDVKACQKAIKLANSGQRDAAYVQFSLLHRHTGNEEEVTLLYWLAFTTPNAEECERMVSTIARVEPNHPKLQELRAFQSRKFGHLMAPAPPLPVTTITVPIDDEIADVKQEIERLRLNLRTVNMRMANIRARYNQQYHMHGIFGALQRNTKNANLASYQPTKESLQREKLGLEAYLHHLKTLKAQGVQWVERQKHWG